MAAASASLHVAAACSQGRSFAAIFLRKSGHSSLLPGWGIPCSMSAGGISGHGYGERRRVAGFSTQAFVAEGRVVPRLRGVYLQTVVPALMDAFHYSNVLQVPKLEKVVVSCGFDEASQNSRAIESATKDISIITGQRPVVTRSKKAMSNSKIRKDIPARIAVTLRGEIMYSFMDRLINLVLPHARDFFGVSRYSFYGKGNFDLHLKQQSAFPEIKFAGIDQTRGMDILIATSAKTDKEGRLLLSYLGLPFWKGASVMRKKKQNFSEDPNAGKSK